ncbi:hypothetical protein BBK14_20495 [Parafrankia soli]|uniref:Excalibur calcium-binding domain-containing protein n=1 Tax=Parafrankia soli TaxID=2599596 RepID=A0A1S1PXQ4_9ACTN|nr:excalibur calcium-binding domain-containing protein [Parafrankia soli]OHV27453.1 hypothetical protein BBK14_20495 [Parafrankia soli]
MRMLRQRPVEWGHGIHAWVRGHRRVGGGVGGVLLLLLVAAALAPAPGSGAARSGAVGALAEPAPVAIPTTPGPSPAPPVAPPAPSAVPRPSAAPARVAAAPPPAPPSPAETTPTAEQTAAPTPTPSATPDQARPPRPATTSYQSCADARAAGAAPLHRGQPGYRSALDDDGDGTACEQDRPSALCDEDAGAQRGGLPILEYLSCWLPDL